MLTVPQMITRIRETNGDTQEGLARRLGVSYPTINSWERGRSQPHERNRAEIAALASSLGIAQEMTVLVIDDDPVTAELVRAAASVVDAAVTVESALDGWEGLVKCGSLRPALVFLDVMMPGIDGLEVARRLPSLEGLADMQVVFVTASQSPDVLGRIAQAGRAMLAKPLELDALSAAVETVLRGESVR